MQEQVVRGIFLSQVCVVIPTYNEAENLPKLLEALGEVLQKEAFRIIVVDDNSPEGTVEIAKKLNERYGNIITHRRPHARKFTGKR